MRKKVILIIIFAAVFNKVIAQEKLIDFTIKQIEKNSIEINWTNPYSNTIQLSIQKSSDNKNFRTILSAQKPALLNNKIIDTQLPIDAKIYYRIYYVLTGGSFYFSNTLNTADDLLKTDNKQALSIDNKIANDINTKLTNKKSTPIESRLPNIDKTNTLNQQIPTFKNLTNTTSSSNSNNISTDKIQLPNKDLINEKDSSSNNVSFISKAIKNETLAEKESVIEYYYHTPIKNREIVKLNLNLGFENKNVIRIKNIKSNIKPIEYIFIYEKDSLLTRLDPIAFLKYKDSLRLKTKDTLYIYNKTYASIHAYIPVYVWKPSIYVFNTKKGEPTIQIATAKKHKYQVVFKDEKGIFLFQLSPIKEEQLFLDKSNFLHAGWFEFELYEDEKLLEKSKIYIQL
ncbi:MAG: hypothetical protein WCG74_01370 [Sediminibacterium sp.]